MSMALVVGEAGSTRSRCCCVHTGMVTLVNQLDVHHYHMQF